MYTLFIIDAWKVIMCLFLILIKTVIIFLYTGIWQGRGAGKKCRALARSQICIQIGYTFYNRCAEIHYLPVTYPYQNCDHITTMLFHTIFLYTGLWQGRGAGKRCLALARAQIYIYTLGLLKFRLPW